MAHGIRCDTSPRANWTIWFWGALSWVIPFAAAVPFFDPAGGLTVPQPLLVVRGGATGAGLMVLALRRARRAPPPGWPSAAVGSDQPRLDALVLLPMPGVRLPDDLTDTGLRDPLLPIAGAAMDAVAR